MHLCLLEKLVKFSETPSPRMWLVQNPKQPEYYPAPCSGGKTPDDKVTRGLTLQDTSVACLGSVFETKACPLCPRATSYFMETRYPERRQAWLKGGAENRRQPGPWIRSDCAHWAVLPPPAGDRVRLVRALALGGAQRRPGATLPSAEVRNAKS